MALPSSPTTLLQILASYLYQEYADDDNLQGFVAAYNNLAQNYLDWFNAVNLPIYTGPLVSGPLLDWVGQGLYDIPRPSLPFGSVSRVVAGPYNTFAYNTLPFNGMQVGVNAVGAGIGQFIIGVSAIGVGSSELVSDDVYRRVITWKFFKGDGQRFSTPWLKRRIERFLNGTNGINYNVDNTYQVSITFDVNDVVISLPNSAPLGVVFQAAVNTGVLELPFQFSYTIDLV